jgi:hypothetical protein
MGFFQCVYPDGPWKANPAKVSKRPSAATAAAAATKTNDEVAAAEPEPKKPKAGIVCLCFLISNQLQKIMHSKCRHIIVHFLMIFVLI